MSQSRIQLAGVSKQWGAIAAVDDISFEVTPGQFVILLGPSGCGKSTTLRMIAGLEEASSGAIHIGERNVTRAPPGDRGLSMVFQSYALFPHLSVAENIVFGLKSRRVPRAERQKRLAHVAELVDLTPYLDRKPANLSGGQRQRVALARAIVSEHPICLMDEPLSNLDARLRTEMRREIKALQRRLDMTVIYVTHDQVEAMSMGDRVILMQHGRIVQDATPSELYNQPASAFAASFIGSPAMNLLPLVAGVAGAVIDGDTTPVAPLEAAGGQLGVRPEDIELRPENAPGVAARIEGEEYLGADTVVHVSVGSHSLRVRVAGRPAIEEAACRLYWAPEKAHLFAADGLRHEHLAPRAFAAAPRSVARPPTVGSFQH
ncbi:MULTISPECIES: ABC transporter ATP-binding protein [unclassified Halomonas]|uniref:ABC transporter ATP-binding protein n=1 Tax=unclassified Halomonas TaxID=2609666 RepID=UPI0021E4F2FE|nr:MULTISPECIES: ABC transporter ATP-binding protein [unclassified Halomonas]UYG00399.1 ABC transporter ATP-binding protein [Halomonas sp. GD1P12]WNL38526.1 ABC transporter ATP-binding protein [Halomonas sp. PAMB 3232]WNL41872.1 ABC transporter ATP-binding protein [Halomonas sp. PAMB 3264]